MTWVTLIPKFKGAKEVKGFRLISMVRCGYKVVSKVLETPKHDGGLVGKE